MLPISTFNGIQKNRNLTMIKINTENKRAKYCCYLHKNKKCFRNIYAPHGAKFRLIFSVEAKPVRSK